MRNILKILPVVFIFMLLSGCAVTQKQDGGGYRIFSVNSGKTKLTETSYSPSAGEQKKIAEEFLVQLKTTPENLEYVSALPEEVNINGYSLEGTRLTVDFNQAYLNMDNVTEVLLRAAVVKTMIQIEGIDEVCFAIEGAPLLDNQGVQIGPMTDITFIDTKGEGINSYQYASLSLYFPTADGSKVEKEMRNVHYSTNTTLEKVVIEQLLAGPVNANLQPLLPSDTKVIGVTVDKNTCIVNFEENILNTSNPGNATAEAVIFGIVNSIVDVCGVEKVQFEVEGETDRVYRALSFKNAFARNKDIIQSVEGAGETEVSNTESLPLEPAQTEPGTTESTKGKSQTEVQSNVHEPAIGIDPNLQNTKGDESN